VGVEPSRLRELELFSGVDEQLIDRLARSAELKPASPGVVLAREGASGYTFFVILSGTVEVERGGTFLETLGPGDFFGEMAILGGSRRNATVTASSPVELLVLFGTEFRTLEQDHPDVADRIKHTVAERVERARSPQSQPISEAGESHPPPPT
jgi:CRP-like cAMP-binding protein